jgi:hypothetical protein
LLLDESSKSESAELQHSLSYSAPCRDGAALKEMFARHSYMDIFSFDDKLCGGGGGWK